MHHAINDTVHPGMVPHWLVLSIGAGYVAAGRHTPCGRGYFAMGRIAKIQTFTDTSLQLNTPRQQQKIGASRLLHKIRSNDFHFFYKVLDSIWVIGLLNRRKCHDS